jgi:hypothetical protein
VFAPKRSKRSTFYIVHDSFNCLLLLFDVQTNAVPDELDFASLLASAFVPAASHDNCHLHVITRLNFVN